MHVKEARIHGERELRIHHLAAWRESTLFAPRERELSDLTFEVMVINGWNRANVAFKTAPGSSDKASGFEKASLV
ncbi:hypothetical protein LMG28138_02566 [Pararobbsia alpina]|uniref:Uncharacterized protein n=1 Tax=Pararobbsia alpina TaxID=621374 RepID=A0A6S7B5S6_9BURK|nr:hypothetical protein LMG28138_02566 [Pararobbsia alpina]